MNKVRKQTRLKHYKLALEKYKNDPNCLGLCIVIGEIVHGSLFAAPWTEFEELVKYYPELTKPTNSKNDRIFKNKRIKILETAIKQLQS